MNVICLLGRLTTDPELRRTQTDTAVTSFSVAVDRAFQPKDSEQRQADFINCVAFDRAGEFAEKYFHQGMRVLVSGRIQTSNYTNKEGKKVYTTDVIVDDQEFADSKGAASNGNQSQDRPVPTNAVGDGFMNIPDGVEDEGLPFN